MSVKFTPPPMGYDELLRDVEVVYERWTLGHEAKDYLCSVVIPLLKEERLVELPCKVGDPVYKIEQHKQTPYTFRVRKGVCTKICLTECGVQLFASTSDTDGSSEWGSCGIYHDKDSVKNVLFSLAYCGSNDEEGREP